jgi:hypothetical protein
MTMTIYLSLLVAIAGFVWCLLTANPKHEKLALIAYGCGLLAFLFGFSGHALTVIH